MDIELYREQCGEIAVTIRRSTSGLVRREHEMGLHDYALTSVASCGDRPAIMESNGWCMSYSRLSRVSAMLRDRLAALRILRGDRVGVYLRKSADSVASLLGVLRVGAGVCAGRSWSAGIAQCLHPCQL